MNEVETVLQALEQANGILENAHIQWDKYQKLKSEVSIAAKTDPYMNDSVANQILQYADNYKSDFGNVAIMESAVFLIKRGRNQQQIEKIIDASYKLALKEMPYLMAVEGLNDSLNCDTGILSSVYPELKKLSQTELANGKAVDFIAEKLGEDNGR